MTNDIDLIDTNGQEWTRTSRFVALREECEMLRDMLDDWRASATHAAEETCGNEKHCTCVGVLRKVLAEQRAELAKARAELVIAKCDHNWQNATYINNPQPWLQMVHCTKCGASGHLTATNCSPDAPPQPGGPQP